MCICKNVVKMIAAAVAASMIILINWIPVQAEELSVSAKAFVLMEAQTGRILCSSNEHQQLPIASTTKIMTALLTLEQGKLDTPFIAEEDQIRVEGSSMGLLPGDEVTLRDLCYGMLLASGNDAANLAAVRIAGSLENFAVLMNERAAEIGMANSHFVTPSGLHDEEHYSTAYDMALLTREALQNSEFANICSQSKAKLSFGNPPYDRWFSNHNKLLRSYEGCIGVKTGFTKSAGRCLVSAAQRNGITLICVTLNAPNDWKDHTTLLDYGFQSLSDWELVPDLQNTTINVVGGQKEQLSVSAEPVHVMLTQQEQEQLETEILLEPFYYAPLQTGEEIGKYRYLLNGVEVASGKITVQDGCSQNDAPVQYYSLWQRIRHIWLTLFEK